MKRRILVMVLALTMLVTACSSGSSDAVATVDGVDIPQEIFNAYYGIQRESLIAQLGPDALDEVVDPDLGRTAGEMLRKGLLDSLITNQVLINEANKLELNVDDELEEQISMEKEIQGEEAFTEMLSEIGITEEIYREMLRGNLLVYKLRDDKMASYEIPEEDVKAYYDEHSEELVQVKARHILVETEEEALKIKERLAQGEDFADLAKELSIDTGSAINGGEIDYFPMGVMVEPFEEYAFTAEVNQVSDPIESDFGFHIIEVLDKKDGLEDSKDDILNILKAEKFQEEKESLESSAKVKKHLDVSKEVEAFKNADVKEDVPTETSEENLDTTEESTEEVTEEETEEETTEKP